MEGNISANINEKKIVNPPIFNILDFFSYSSVIPFSFIQMVPNTFGLYQTNLSKSVIMEETKIAKKLYGILLYFSNLLVKCKKLFLINFVFLTGKQ